MDFLHQCAVVQTVVVRLDVEARFSRASLMLHVVRKDQVQDQAEVGKLVYYGVL